MSTRAPAARRIDPPTTGRSATRSSLIPVVALGVTIGGSLVIGALAAGSPIIAVFGALALLASLAIAIRPDYAVLIVVALIYSNAPVVLVNFHGAPFVLVGIVPIVLVAPLAYDLLVQRRPIVITPALPWIVAFLVVQTLSTIWANDISSAFDALSTFLFEGLLLYVLITNTVRTPTLIRQIIWTLLLVGGALGALSLWQELTSTYTNSYFGFAQTDAAITGISDGFERLAGPIGEKNRYAQVMLMLVPLAIIQASAERSRLLKLAALGCGALAAIAVALTFSRGAALAAAMLLLAMIALRYIRPSHVLVAIGLVVVVAIAVPAYGQRLTSLADITQIFSDEPAAAGTDNSLLSRATENLAALNVFLDHPILGVGPNQFPEYYRAYADEIGISVKAADRQAHNLYLQAAADTGILGFVTFVGAMLVTLVQLAKARAAALRRRRPDLAAMATGFLLAMVAYMATGIFLHLSYARYFWMMLALAGVTAHVVLQTLRDEEADPVEA